MSTSTFESKIGAGLRDTPGLWSYHPVDAPTTKTWLPGDFIFGHRRGWGVLECKEVEGITFPLSRWTPQQRRSCADVQAAGGLYLLCIRFAYTAVEGSKLKLAHSAIRLIAPEPPHITSERGSLSASWGRELVSTRVIGMRLMEPGLRF